MATPNYKGAGQPSTNGGSWLASLAGGTPAYKSASKGTNTSSYAGSGPAYKPAPVAQPSPDEVTPTTPGPDDDDACGGGSIAIVIPRQVIEQ